jgi:hypothetical protein
VSAYVGGGGGDTPALLDAIVVASGGWEGDPADDDYDDDDEEGCARRSAEVCERMMRANYFPVVAGELVGRRFLKRGGESRCFVFTFFRSSRKGTVDDTSLPPPLPPSIFFFRAGRSFLAFGARAFVVSRVIRPSVEH